MGTKNKTIIAILIIGTILLGGLIYYQNYYMGDYIVQRQWISSVSEDSNNTYCDECLWIEFYGGCNRYIKYYFENQHEFDERFSKGSIVNINWREFEGKNYIRGIKLAKEYRSKC